MTVVNWEEIDTLLLDIDGTLLDRNFDDILWEQLLPSRYSENNGFDADSARKALLQHMRELAHTLDYYRIDYWTEYTGVDLLALHHEVAHLLEFRPGARAFLDWLRRKDICSILVTNAHRDCFAVKDSYCDLSDEIATIVSCHDYGHPKETQEFWESLNEAHPFDSARTLFIDDDEAVLDAARQYGIKHLLTIRQPDSKRPVRRGLRFPSINNLMELVPADLVAPKFLVHGYSRWRFA
ncbi:MAG: GMP/IMP nucleotidase [Gammaproteobacteria bacterium]|nr:GMP/IMP nucleotidase [Gammaproteobacteria bacterium]